MMAAQAAGATVPHLNVEDIRNLDISRLPRSRDQQAAAADVLGAIDDLVENNRRRVEVLEEMRGRSTRSGSSASASPATRPQPLSTALSGPCLKAGVWSQVSGRGCDWINSVLKRAITLGICGRHAFLTPSECLCIDSGLNLFVFCRRVARRLFDHASFLPERYASSASGRSVRPQ